MLVGAVSVSRAQSTDAAPTSHDVRATIVRIDGQDVFIDAGGAQLEPNATLTVYRKITVRHPVTRAPLHDRFVIGALTVKQVGQALSLAQAHGEPARAFEVGDIAEALGVRPVTAAPPPAQEAAPASQPSVVGVDPETDELVRYWRATLGQPPAQRIEQYRAFLKRWPATRHARALADEIAYLSGADGSRTASATPTRATRPIVRVQAVRLARVGDPIDLAGLYDPAHPPHRLVLFSRTTGEREYSATAMQDDLRGHVRARIGAQHVQAAGVQYFIEAVDEQGRASPVLASAKQPVEVEVLATGDQPRPKEPRTSVRFSSELVSFEGASGDDYFLVNEGDFFHRLDLGVLHGVRMGYGHFLGRGGKLDQEGRSIEGDPQAAGFSYGFFEGELALDRLFGLALRGTIGLGRPEDIAERDGLAGGFQLRARIGTATGTRLVVAGEVVPEIGQRAFLGLRWEVVNQVPMSTEVHVTDQPVNSDELAVRLVQEVGYRFGERFTLALRPSYQLRTIKHAGPGIGLAATFDW